jgi:hypothetical protein
VGNAGGLVRMSQSFGGWAEEKLAATAVKSENDSGRDAENDEAPEQAYEAEKYLTRARSGHPLFGYLH